MVANLRHHAADRAAVLRMRLAAAELPPSAFHLGT
jgi:hypothetical protein